MTRAEILDCLTDRPCDVCKFHESGKCERWDCVFEEKPDDAEESRETDDYENEIADLQNRLDIAEYDKDRWKEKVTVLEEKLKSLSAETCEDAISRQAALDVIAETDITNGTEPVFTGKQVQALLRDLPLVTPKQKMGHWISLGVQGEVDGQIVRAFTCSECGAISIFRLSCGNIVNGDLCPNCMAKMEVAENG